MRWFRKMKDNAIPSVIVAIADVKSTLGGDPSRGGRGGAGAGGRWPWDVAHHDPAPRHDLPRLHEQQVARPQVFERGRSYGSVFVAVDDTRGAFQESTQLAPGAGLRVVLQGPTTGKHHADDGARQVLLQRQGSGDRQEGNDVDAGLAGEEAPDDGGG